MLRQFMGELWRQGGEPWKGLFSRMQQAMVRLYLPLDNWVIVVSTRIWIGGGAYSYRRG